MPLLKFRNFTAAARKRNMPQFGMYRAEAVGDLAVIEDAADTPVGITGTQDGSSTTFIISAPIASLYLNGMRQSTPEDYSVAGSILTWVLPPAADDIILGFAV